MIEPEFTFLQVKIEGRRTHASETCQTGFGESPEAFDPVDMGVTGYKLVLSVVYPEVFPVSDVDQTIITAPFDQRSSDPARLIDPPELLEQGTW